MITMIMIDKQYAMYCFCFGEMISTALEFDIIVSEKGKEYKLCQFYL